MTTYPAIADHGLIGDLQTAALVSGDGTVDWFCCPRFDSPSVFASLLDQERGGRFRIAPVGEHVVRQLYFPDTAVLITRFMGEGGVGEVIDFMPVIEDRTATPNHRLVRVMRTVRGEMRFALTCEPRFDYGRQPHDVQLTEDGAVFTGAGLELTLHSGVPLERQGDDVRAEVTLRAGDVAGVMLESAADGPPRRPSPDELLGSFLDTGRFWRGWLATSTYRGRWREAVNRSAITLMVIS